MPKTYTHAEIKKIVIKAFAEMLGYSINQLDTTKNVDELGGDSLDMIEIVMVLEEEFC